MNVNGIQSHGLSLSSEGTWLTGKQGPASDSVAETDTGGRSDAGDRRAVGAAAGGAGMGRPDRDEYIPQKETKDRRKAVTTDTEKADREIESLKREKERIERLLEAARKPEKIRMLEQELARLETELRQKDNDAYRRANARFF